jgi:hypothetical protein
MNTLIEKCMKIEILLDEIIILVSSEIGKNPFLDLEKAKKIVAQKNINQLPFVKKKLDNLTMLLYNGNLASSNEIFQKLNDIYILL